jgi:hypothetical protein
MANSKSKRNTKNGGIIIYAIKLKSGASILVEEENSLEEFNQAKHDCIKSMILNKIVYEDNKKLLVKTLVDLYSIETMEEVFENKKEMK